MEQIRMVDWFAQAMIDAGQIERYDKPRPLKDGTGTAIGIWKMELSSQVLDDPAISQVEIVVVAGKEL